MVAWFIWIHKHVGERGKHWTWHYEYEPRYAMTIEFANEADAVMFCLRWIEE
jgi:hypothetical protein